MSVAPAPAPAKPKPPTYRKDSVRETLETIVFVVVLVFLLKQFVVEAFVIPTGSMAETLYGWQKTVTCPECGHDFTLNSSCERDPSDGVIRFVHGYCCPNCRFKHPYGPGEKSPANEPGDRVLVHKAQYHKFPATPGDVVVFKFPKEPQKNFGAINYIKRMWATGGQTLAIWRGDLYVTDALTCPPEAMDENGSPLYPRPDDANDLWKLNYTYHNNAEALNLFDKSRKAGFPADGKGFTLIRKSDEIVNAMQRLVYDNDHQAAFLKKEGVKPRWTAAKDWTADGENKTFTHAGSGLGWVRYKHLISDDWRTGLPNIEPRPIDNFLGYNAETGMTQGGEYKLVLDNENGDHRFWVGDLAVECKVQATDDTAAVTLELSKGTDRFQATFQSGVLRVFRIRAQFKSDIEGGVRTLRAGQVVEMAKVDAPSLAGVHRLRFANIDCRLRVYIDGKAINLGAAADYAPEMPAEFDPADSKKEGWTTANDVNEPVSVGASGAVTVSNLKIYRDSIFLNENYKYATNISGTIHSYHVHPGHYLCLGDNSAQSSDGRVWGTVPERLMLGKASFIFWPYDRVGFIK